MRTRWFLLAFTTSFCVAAQGSPPLLAQKADPAPSDAAAFQKLSDQLSKIKAKVHVDKTNPDWTLYAISFNGPPFAPEDMAQLRAILQDTKLPIHVLISASDAELAQLKDLSCIRSLSLIAGRSVTDAGMEHIASLSNLECFTDASSEKVTDAGLAHLAKLKKLRILTVGFIVPARSKITDAGLKQLSGMASLRHLSVWGDKITDAGLEHLALLTDLEVLGVTSNSVTDAGLAHLSKLSKLTSLFVQSRKITVAGYAHLARLTALEEFYVGDRNLGDAELAHMKAMSRLKRLWIGGDTLSDAGLANMAGMAGLHELSIQGGEFTGAGLARLAGLKNLKKMTFTRCSRALTGDTLAPLASFNGLRELTIEKSAIDAQAARQIGKARSVESLHLDTDIADEVFEGIAGMANLKQLTFKPTSVGDAALRHLSGLKSLRSLDLRKSKVTDAGMQHLRDLTGLETLYLDGTQVTDDGLKHLAGLTELKDLSLGKCNITGAGLKHLSALAKLESLHLSNTRVKNDDLPQLQGLKKLTKLTFSGTEVGKSGLLALKKALPAAKIYDAYGDEVSLAPRKFEDFSKIKPDFSMTAVEYFAEFKADWKAASAKYQKKVVELTGVIAEVGLSGGFGTNPYLRLDILSEEAKKKKGPFAPRMARYEGIDCLTVDEQPWARYSPGQKVKIIGRQVDRERGTALHVLYADSIPALSDCAIVESSPNPAIPVTVADLVKEFADDAQATRKKYSGKYVLLSGTVVSRESVKSIVPNFPQSVLRMRTEGPIELQCKVKVLQERSARGVKAGETITVWGSCQFPSRSTTITVECLPIKKD
jgi:Leucine-rich repeat (LRR) protein